jgi:hypothetical protein
VCFSDILPELSNEAENAAALALALTGPLSRILEHDPAQDEPEPNRPAGTLSKPTRSQHVCAPSWANMWVGSASEDTSMSPPWAKNPQALAGRLRRAQTFLRMLDIEVIFSREGDRGRG